jgi:uncharacterized DUF497 family protein
MNGIKQKNKINIEKHGVAFENATAVFDGFHITAEDARKDYGETRFYTMGTLGEERRVVLVAYTYRDKKIRIISARKTNLREQKIFYQYRQIHLEEKTQWIKIEA